MVSLANLIRCLGLFLLIRSLTAVPGIVFYFRESFGDAEHYTSVTLIPVVLNFGAGLFFTFKGGAIATFLRRGETDPRPVPVLEAGFFLIGTWWLIQGISDLVYLFAEVRRTKGDSSNDFVGTEQFSLFIATLVEMTLAAILLMKGRQIARLLTSAPHAGPQEE